MISLDFLKENSEDWLRTACQAHRVIEQGPLLMGPGMYLRIRKSIVKNETEWLMTFKSKDLDRTVEVETKLDDRDGKNLFRKCSWHLRKERFDIFGLGDLVWELDLFKTKKGKVYFILLEVELDEGSPRPDNMPMFLKKHVLFEVPLTDNRFSNTRLGDVQYAKELYLKFQGGNNDDEDEEEDDNDV